jgi:hypothetical protein
VDNAVHLGVPRRAWMLASLSNERDRPSLTLPRLQAVADVLDALGWRGARQDAASIRDTAPNALQPAILANGTMAGWLTRLSENHALTKVAVDASSPESLVEELFLRLLTRRPTAAEMTRHAAYLSEGFAQRIVATPAPTTPPHRAPRFVTWTNHLQPEADGWKLEDAELAKRGEPATTRLEPAWRQRCEDVVWAIINQPEMLYRP